MLKLSFMLKLSHENSFLPFCTWLPLEDETIVSSVNCVEHLSMKLICKVNSMVYVVLYI